MSGPGSQGRRPDFLIVGEMRCGTTTVWEIDQQGEPSVAHPTQKPLEIFTRPLEYHTRPGEIALEPFSGSGSQIIAAESLGRRCFAMEMSPPFVDVAVRRWEDATGKRAVLESTRLTLQQVEADRKEAGDGGIS